MIITAVQVAAKRCIFPFDKVASPLAACLQCFITSFISDQSYPPSWWEGLPISTLKPSLRWAIGWGVLQSGPAEHMSSECLRAGGGDLKGNQSGEGKVTKTAPQVYNVEPPEERPQQGTWLGRQASRHCVVPVCPQSREEEMLDAMVMHMILKVQK